MKAIKGLIITLIVIVALAGVTVIGGYIYVRSTYGIDLFRTAGQLKTLSQTRRKNSLPPCVFRKRYGGRQDGYGQKPKRTHLV
jgi:hypothetical protein